MPDQSNALLPGHRPPRCIQHPGKPAAARLARIEHLLVVMPERPAANAWQQVPDGKRLGELRRKRKLRETLTGRLANPAQTGVSLALLPDSGRGKRAPDAFALLEFAGKLAADALRDNPASVGLLVAGFAPEVAERVARALLLAVHAHAFALPDYRSKAEHPPRLRRLALFGLESRTDLARVEAEARALNLARWFTAQPPNMLDMRGYRGALEALADEHGWEAEFLDEPRLGELGAGAFLAVARGNQAPGAGIMRLRYRPSDTAAAPRVALVGKGIIFDTGGTNLKPFKAMLDMHHDMAGSAVAVATLLALTELEVPFGVDCWLAITENRIAPEAYKSRDVVTASDGTTIEVIHTDAEGRMALADTLALAGREEPELIVDFATLTGSCVAALTERYSGAFCNHEELHARIVGAGRRSGERVWTFPMDPDFDADLKSRVADVLQCAPDGGGDHIQAARFLHRFVPAASDWVHVDLSAATRKGGLAQVPGEVTGFGARFALALLLDELDLAADDTGADDA